ncbi:MAG: hypothetical protein PHO02_02445 [Candidatus Nanoarchaeia archaeon]|nr:hypothetical protein [Candidatus Nanoarchaeia archaeon]
MKRGQVTLYVTIGLVVVALAVLLIMMRQGAFLNQWEKDRQEALAVPQQAAEIHRYASDCIGQISEEGVSLLGMQGGYIELPAEKNLPSLNHPFSESLEVLPGMRTPFWFYIAGNRVQKTITPTRNEMETALEEYIKQRSGECTLNFELFDRFNASFGNVKVDSSINDDVVLVTVDFPIKVEMGDFVYRIPKIYSKVDARIGEMYSIGRELLNRENNDYYLEEKTIDILAMYEGIPYSGTEMTCSPKVWTKSGIEQELKKALNANMQFIKLKGTAYEASNKYFAWDALSKNHKEISSTFRYTTDWPVKMDVFPSEGEILTAKPFNDVGNSAMAFLTSIFCINDYHFVYDVMHPVLVTLSDENGYIFQFAIMVSIDNNQPRENKEGTFDVPEADNRICSEAQGRARVYSVAPDSEGNLQPVNGAEIKIKCISTVCEVGTTSVDRNSRETYFEGRVPQCANALMTASREGYLDARQIVNTVSEDTYSLMLEPYKEFDYEIIVVEDGFERSLNTGETAIISISNEENGFAASAASAAGKIRLVAGRHNIQTSLVSKGFEITIKGNEVTHCVEQPTRNIFGLLGFTEESCSTTTTPDMTLDNVVSGGSASTWDLSREDFSKGQKIIFYVPATAAPSTVEEMETAFAMADNPANAIMPKVEWEE